MRINHCKCVDRDEMALLPRWLQIPQAKVRRRVRRRFPTPQFNTVEFTSVRLVNAQTATIFVVMTRRQIQRSNV
jgi:hypothetical protein